MFIFKTVIGFIDHVNKSLHFLVVKVIRGQKIFNLFLQKLVHGGNSIVKNQKFINEEI